MYLYPLHLTSINRHFNKFARSFWSKRLDIRWRAWKPLMVSSKWNLRWFSSTNSTIDWLLLRKFFLFSMFLMVFEKFFISFYEDKRNQAKKLFNSFVCIWYANFLIFPWEMELLMLLFFLSFCSWWGEAPQ